MPVLHRQGSPSGRLTTVADVRVHDLLFNDGDLRLALEEQNEGLRAEVERAPEDHVLQADEDAWAEALAERWRLATPALRPDDVWMDEPRDVKVDVSWDHFNRAILDPSQPAYVAGHQTVVHIPFDGDKSIFRMRASQYSLSPPRAAIGEGELRLVIEYPSDRPTDIRAETQGLINSVEQNLRFARNDVDQHNRGLEQLARNAIADRRRRVQAHREHLERTGLPVGPPGQRAKTYIAEALVRRPAPALATTPANEPIKLEPILATEVFEHILEVIRLTAVGIERSPRTYADMNEEALRTVLLDALNTHYRGGGTAEAFNVGGKTDILVRHEGSNLFIGECKFWSGPKGFTDALDQLLSYTAWRDTKLALIVFVRDRKLTGVIESARAALAAHPSFERWVAAANEEELRAVVHWPGDDRRFADLNVFFVSQLAA